MTQVTRHLPDQHRGFTLLEVLTVVGIVALLAQIAITAYSKYVARARAADIELQFDAARTRAATAMRGGAVPEACDALAPQLKSADLRSDYASLDVTFEAVPNGFAPMLRVCATRDLHGARGVDVTREAHSLLSRVTTMGKGAVIGDSAVSFAVPLSDGKAACRLAPATAAACAAPAPVLATAAAQPSATTTPTATASAATTAQAPAVPASAAQSTCVPSQTQVTRSVPRDVMTFGSARTGYAMNDGDLKTGGDLRAFTFEIALVGGAQVATSGVHGATIFSYASRSDTNEFLIWDPTNVKITFGGRQDVPTGVNVNDGANHRLTLAWDSATGTMTLYDNGRQAWQGIFNQGGVLRGNGKLVLAQDQDSYGGGFDPNDAFQGQIVTSALASAASTAAQVGSGPIQTYFNKGNGLITQTVMGPDGRVMDATGQHAYTTGGALSKTTQLVDTKLFVTSSCN